MNDQNLRFVLMPPMVIVKKHGIGFSDDNYEIFMLQLLNQSRYFLKKGGLEYWAPDSEESGQCDANSVHYSIDFKLLVAQTVMMAASDLSERQLHDSATGITISFGSKKPNKKMVCTPIHEVLRGKSVNQLKEIRLQKTNLTNIDNDIPQIIKTVEVEKNAMFLFPYIAEFKDPLSRDIALEAIKNVLEESFTPLFLLREEKCLDYDTFLIVEYNLEFLIFEFKQGNLALVDSVQTSKIPAYEYLFKQGDPFWAISRGM